MYRKTSDWSDFRTALESHDLSVTLAPGLRHAKRVSKIHVPEYQVQVSGEGSRLMGRPLPSGEVYRFTEVPAGMRRFWRGARMGRLILNVPPEVTIFVEGWE